MKGKRHTTEEKIRILREPARVAQLTAALAAWRQDIATPTGTR